MNGDKILLKDVEDHSIIRLPDGNIGIAHVSSAIVIGGDIAVEFADASAAFMPARTAVELICTPESAIRRTLRILDAKEREAQ